MEVQICGMTLGSILYQISESKYSVVMIPLLLIIFEILKLSQNSFK